MKQETYDRLVKLQREVRNIQEKINQLGDELFDTIHDDVISTMKDKENG